MSEQSPTPRLMIEHPMTAMDQVFNDLHLRYGWWHTMPFTAPPDWGNCPACEEYERLMVIQREVTARRRVDREREMMLSILTKILDSCYVLIDDLPGVLIDGTIDDLTEQEVTFLRVLKAEGRQ